MSDEKNFNYISFFTATIVDWNPILYNDKLKDIIVSSMRFMVNDGRLRIFAFVIMPSHIHIVWRVKNERRTQDIQRDFLKYTAQQIKFELERSNPEILRKFYVGAKDRKYQIWKRNPLTSRLPSIELVEQKIHYIHGNPERGKWKLCENFEDHEYSSAGFYYKDEKRWDFLMNYSEAIDE